MAHLMAAVNPKAVERMQQDAAAAREPQEGAPLPGVATMVLYHPPAGAVRRGRTVVPAMVMWHRDGRRLDLMVIPESGDFIEQQNIPEWTEGNSGWERIEVAPQAAANLLSVPKMIEELRADLTALRASILGEYNAPDGESVLSILAEYDDRLGKVEKLMAKAAKGAHKALTAKAKPSAADVAAARSRLDATAAAIDQEHRAGRRSRRGARA